MRFSVVIPVYNVEKYIEKCIQSVLDQSHSSVEIICVNDGSKDQSVNIITRNFHHIDNVILVHQENQGMSVARNTGISHASGEYILFLDSDDSLKPNILNKIDEHLRVFGSDIVTFGLDRVDYNGNVLMTEQLFDQSVMPSREALVKFSPSVWNKVYSKKIVSRICFPPKIYYEDLVFTSIALALANKISCMDVVGYNYLQRDGSIINTFNEKCMDIFQAVDCLASDFKSHGLDKEYESELNYLITLHLVLGHLSRCASEPSATKRKEYCADVYNYMNLNYPDYASNVYLKHTQNDSMILKLMKKYGIIIFSKQKFHWVLHLYRMMMKLKLIKLKRW